MLCCKFSWLIHNRMKLIMKIPLSTKQDLKEILAHKLSDALPLDDVNERISLCMLSPLRPF